MEIATSNGDLMKWNATTDGSRKCGGHMWERWYTYLKVIIVHS